MHPADRALLDLVAKYLRAAMPNPQGEVDGWDMGTPAARLAKLREIRHVLDEYKADKYRTHVDGI